MKLRHWLLSAAVALGPVLSGAEVRVEEFAGRQIELCMIGDSITWVAHGDCWRKRMLDELPALAFVGTHSAKFGYSHAGEGGNTAREVLRRIDDRASVPDSRYYHLLVGVNDNNAAKKAGDVPGQARKTADLIVEIVRHLEARPRTEKIFLGSLLPCGRANDLELWKFRDQANQEVNRILRADFPTLFPSGKVVWVEYEKSLRPLPNWRTIIELHPDEEGYALLARMLADVPRREPVAATAAPAAKCGVKIQNLWREEAMESQPLIPGWYTVSFDATEVTGDELEFSVESCAPQKLRFPIHQKFSVKVVPGERIEAGFYTGNHTRNAVTVKPENGRISKVLLEKMRPSLRASRYGVGEYLDSSSPMRLGELLIPMD